MPSPTDDTSWDDVYAELGIDLPKPKPAAEPTPSPTHAKHEPPAEEASFDEQPMEPWADEVPPLSVEAGTDDMIVQAGDLEDEGEDAPEGEAGEGGEGAGGPERKRRRRRRRRRKGGPEEASDAPAAMDGTPRAEGYEEEEPEPVAVHAGHISDEPHADTLRDLIAHWNVPSWDEIISGLYRPER